MYQSVYQEKRKVGNGATYFMPLYLLCLRCYSRSLRLLLDGRYTVMYRRPTHLARQRRLHPRHMCIDRVNDSLEVTLKIRIFAHATRYPLQTHRTQRLIQTQQHTG